jgi:hypothetical protein
MCNLTVRQFQVVFIFVIKIRLIQCNFYCEALFTAFISIARPDPGNVLIISFTKVAGAD